MSQDEKLATDEKPKPKFVAPVEEYRGETSDKVLNRLLEAGMAEASIAIETKGRRSKKWGLAVEAFENGFFGGLMRNSGTPTVAALANARLLASEPFRADISEIKNKRGKVVVKSRVSAVAWTLRRQKSPDGSTYTYRPERPNEMVRRMKKDGIKNRHLTLESQKDWLESSIDEALAPVMGAFTRKKRSVKMGAHRPASPARPKS